MSPLKTVPLGELATVERCSIQPADIKPGTIYVGLEDIESGGRILNPRPVNPGDLASTKFLFSESHVLYGKLRPYLGKIAAPDFAGICSTDIVPLLPGPRIERRYLLHFLRQPRMVAFASARSVGINLPRLSPSVLETIPIPLPTLAEQRRIADILDQTDELRDKRRAVTAQLQLLAKAIFLGMFAASPGEQWPLTTVGGVAAQRPDAIRTGPFGSDLLHSEFVDSGVAVLGIDNAVDNQFRWAKPRYISPEKYESLRRYTVYPGDVLITIMGTCGRCAVVPENIPTAINTKHLCCISLDQSLCMPSFLHAYFLYHPTAEHYLAQVAKGAIMSGLNGSVIRKLPLNLPPLSVQREFATKMALLDSIVSSSNDALVTVDALFGSLQDRAFRVEP